MICFCSTSVLFQVIFQKVYHTVLHTNFQGHQHFLSLCLCTHFSSITTPSFYFLPNICLSLRALRLSRIPVIYLDQDLPVLGLICSFVFSLAGEWNEFQFSSIQSFSHVWLFVIPWITAHQASLSITNTQSSLKLMSIESVMPSSHFILCHPLLLRPIPPSIRVFSNESALHMRDSQESSPTPQFNSINSSALSFLHSPTLTSIHYSPDVLLSQFGTSLLFHVQF